MIKKLILIICFSFLIICFSFINIGISNAEGGRCAGGDKLCSPNFTIRVNDISPGMDVKGGSAQSNMKRVLGMFVQKLMIGLGSLALLIMTVGAGYMIVNTGQDELLTKGKTIFMSGVIALIVALSSYYMVSLLQYILY